jgi:hypothetical protein
MIGSAVKIRQPAIARIYVTVFGVFWCGIVGYGAVAAIIARSPGFVVLGLMFAFGFTLCYRLARLAVFAEGGTVLVRNYWRAVRLARAEIEDVRLGNMPNVPFGHQLYLLTSNGRIMTLDATGRQSAVGRNRQRQEQYLLQLRGWLGNPHPAPTDGNSPF